MTTQVKICGLSSPEAVQTAIEGGADYVGFVFFAKSPRFVTPMQATELGGLVGAGVKKVGLVVNADDAALDEIVSVAKPDMLQLHGEESPTRVAEIKAKFGLPVMKAISIGSAGDVVRSHMYDACADMLLFDAKPPEASNLPGGNAVSFDWHLLAADSWDVPWMLAGGLDAANIKDAVEQSGARAVDVSSGVEDRPGVKSADKIVEFLRIAKQI
ncbi:MAG: phosphoribosylanthranilate isomerase [Rhodospirillales bacterium]|nr:phosphoribosylanthranilate isomerase [Rhodospirillales bacterium]